MLSLRCIKLFKSDLKDNYNVTKGVHFNKLFFLNFIFIKES